MLGKLELKEGVDVYTADGRQVGWINGFVLDPATNEVTHIVVQKRWLLPASGIIPIYLLESATEDDVILNPDVDDLDKLPLFNEKHFVGTIKDELEAKKGPLYRPISSYYWYPPDQICMAYPIFGLAYTPWPPAEKYWNSSEETAPLKEGARVISSDEIYVGDIERLFVEPGSNRATHFEITHGVLAKERKRIPAQWIRSVDKDKVRLVVSSQLLRRLPS